MVLIKTNQTSLLLEIEQSKDLKYCLGFTWAFVIPVKYPDQTKQIRSCVFSFFFVVVVVVVLLLLFFHHFNPFMFSFFYVVVVVVVVVVFHHFNPFMPGGTLLPRSLDKFISNVRDVWFVV